MFANVFTIGIWIIAYTANFIDLASLYYLYRATKDRKLLFLLLILANMALVTVVCMILATIGVYGRAFNMIILNSCLPYYVTVPRFVYEANGTHIHREKAFIATVVGATAVAFNFLAWNGQAIFAFVFFWLPFVALFSPLISLKWKGLASEGMGAESKTASTLKAVGRSMALIALALGALFGLLMLTPLGRVSIFARTYFALFTIIYQLPALFYSFGEFHREKQKGQISPSFTATGLPLTAREREVALNLYEGLTYEEIAEKLFVSLSAIKKHAYNIYRKTGAKNNRQLMHMMAEAGEAPISNKEHN
jgi:DNA-binding CsgD family transcriptional regulator